MPSTAQTPKKPLIRTALPGPNARKVLAEDRKYVSPSYTRDYPLVAKRGRGAMVEDVDGNWFLDFSAGIAVVSTGHCHPKVVNAIREQAAELIHMSGTDFYYAGMPELAQKLAASAPGKSAKKVYFGNSGTEAIEAAMKLARIYTGRDKFIAFFNAFHGRTLGSLSLTASRPVQRRGFGPLIPGVTHIPYANCYRCAYNLKPQNCAMHCARVIEDVLFKTTVPSDEVAAIFVEPIQGEAAATLCCRASFCWSCAASVTSTAFCWSPTKCNAAWGAPERCGPASIPAWSPIFYAPPKASPPAFRSAPSSAAPMS